MCYWDSSRYPPGGRWWVIREKAGMGRARACCGWESIAASARGQRGQEGSVGKRPFLDGKSNPIGRGGAVANQVSDPLPVND